MTEVRTSLDASWLLRLGASTRRRPRGAVYAAFTLLAAALFPIVGGVIGIGVGMLGLRLVIGSVDVSSLPPEVAVAGGLVLAFGPIFALVHIWLLAFEGRSLWTVGFSPDGGLARYARGWAIGIAVFAAPVVAMIVAGLLRPNEQAAGVTGLAAVPAVTLIGFGWVVQGAAEETLTRGLMLQAVALRFGTIAGIGASSLVFAALHGLNSNLTALALLNLLLFGVFSCLYALREGSLWGVCALHSAWNWAQGQVFGLPVSGGAVPGGSLLSLRPEGTATITGGAFGPEGGLAVTVVLLLGCAVLLLRPETQQDARRDD